MNLRYTLYLCFSLLAHTTLAQQVYAPEKLGAAINSPYPEFNPVLSQNGQILYFVRANHPENTYGTHDTQDIWHSQLQENGSWSEAQRMPRHLNQNRYNAVYGEFNGGNSLLLHGSYNKKGNIWKKRGFSVSHRSDTGWSKPQPLKIKKFSRKSKGLFTSATISDDGAYLIMSFSKRYNSKNNKLYVSRLKKNGKGYGRPKKLKNSRFAGVEEAPFLSADGKVLYFANNLSGNHQVYRIARQDESGRVWSAPKAMNDSINHFQAWDSYFSTNVKQTYGYFASNRRKGGADIFQIKLIEERPYILVKGKVLNALTRQPLNSSTRLEFYANEQLIDSVSYKPADAYYEAWLPLGNKYQLKARAYTHREKAETIDATALIEFSELEQDLYLEPVYVVKVEGQLLIRRSNTPLPSSANPRLLVNGTAPDSVSIDPISNRYQLWLPYGKDYKVQVQANDFKAEEELLKLSHIDGYQEINKNLFVDTERTATVSGTIYDKKTGEPFSAEVPLQIILNDSIEANILIDGASRSFTLQLPLGTTYVVNAKAEGYYALSETIDLSQEEENIKVLKDLYLAPIEVGQTIRLNNIFFETGKAALKTESFPELDRVITFLEENPKMKIEIGGHTDNVGSVSYNKKLSAQRAKAVVDYVTLKGVEEDRITYKGYGPGKPEADNTTELGRSLNRRVEFTILEIVK